MKTEEEDDGWGTTKQIRTNPKFTAAVFDKDFEDEDFGDSGKKSIFEKEKPPSSQRSKS